MSHQPPAFFVLRKSSGGIRAAVLCTAGGVSSPAIDNKRHREKESPKPVAKPGSTRLPESTPPNDRSISDFQSITRDGQLLTEVALSPPSLPASYQHLALK